MTRFDPPGRVDDLNEQQKKEWSEKVSAWIDAAAVGSPSENDGPRAQFFNALTNPPANDAVVAPISWNAFPRQIKSLPISDKRRWARADSSRDLQDEYCEWSVTKESASGRIVRVTFTCEAPEYWEFLAEVNPDKVLELYRKFVSPSVSRADLFPNGTYNPRNRFNNGTSNGAMHLIQAANTLSAEIELGAAATIRRRRNGQDITDAQSLIRCSQFGEPGRNSDPFIGEQVNALARQKADITINNPVGLYIDGFNPVNWTTLDGTDAREFWKFVRGTEGHFVRAVFEVPPQKGYFVDDIKIGGIKIQTGAQIADFVTIKLEGLATRIGQSTAQPFVGCRGAAAPPPIVPEAAAAMVPPVPLARRTAAVSALPNLVAEARTVDEEQDLLSKLPKALLRRLDFEIADVADGALLALLDYPKLPANLLATRRVSGKIMAFASPDSTFAVTKKLLDSAQHSIVIGIYDFSASHMKDVLLKAMRRGVAVSIMLDTNSPGEDRLFDELAELGAHCVNAPSTSAGGDFAFFGNAHEKIIVIDRQIVMIQSGNWSSNSIPFNEGDGEVIGAFEPGNRDMGVAIHSRSLARFFADLIARDMRLAESGSPDADQPDILAELAADTETAASDLFFEAAPLAMPTLFQSLTVTPASPVNVTPLITPENFHDGIKPLLRSARHSLRIEQQYIRGGQAAITELLEEIRSARAVSPDLDVRIIVSPKFLTGNNRTRFEQAMLDFDLDFNDNYRFLSPSHFVHCHNKLIVIDEEKVIVGSQNWSTTGVLSNREASLLIEHAGIASYFAEIFDADWDLSDSGADPSDLLAEAVAGLRQPADFARGGVVISSASDYADV